MTITVLLADDQAVVRTGFRLVLESEPDITVVGEASDGEHAVELTRRLRPDVVLLDIQMPRVDGLEATRRLTQQAAASRIVILTAFEQDDYVFQALAAKQTREFNHYRYMAFAPDKCSTSGPPKDQLIG